MVAQKSDKKDPVKVFVYGTLKRGFALHDWLNGSEWVADDVLRGHTLIDLGPYPALVKIDSYSRSPFETAGEIYAMPADHFDQLRVMEEKVGYTTIDAVTKNGYMCKVFVFASLTEGIAQWQKAPDGKTSRVVVDFNDEIPF